MFKKFTTIALLSLAALASGPLHAHGGASTKHGGVAQMASDLSFELISTPDGAALYVEDHGKPLAPTGMSGKLTVLNGSEKSEAVLVIAGERLEAKGLKLAKGSKAIANLKTSQQKAIAVRFTFK